MLCTRWGQSPIHKVGGGGNSVRTDTYQTRMHSPTSRAFLLLAAHSPKTSCQFSFLGNPPLLSLTHATLFLLWKSTGVRVRRSPGCRISRVR